MERLLELQAVHPSRAKDTGLTRLGPPPRDSLPVWRARLGVARPAPGAAGLPFDMAAQTAIPLGRSEQQRRQLQWMLVGGNLLLGAALTGLVVSVQLSSRTSHEKKALATAEQFAAIASANLQSELATIDTALRISVDDLQRAGFGAGATVAQINERLEAKHRVLANVEGFRVADERGLVRWGNRIESTDPLDITNRGFFHEARESAVDKAVVSEPVQSRVSGNWVIVVARRLAWGGKFQGVLYASVRVDHFVDLFKQYELGTGDVVALRNAELRLLARWSPGSAAAGAVGSQDAPPELRASLQRNPAAGSFMATSPIDARQRTVAYRQVEGWPFVVVAGLDTARFLGQWRDETRKVAILASLVWALACAAAMLAYRFSLRELTALSALGAQIRHVQMLLRVAGDGIHIVDSQGHLVEMSDSFAEMLRSTRERLQGQHVSSWDANQDSARIQAWLHKTRDGDRQRVEVQHRRADGSIIDVDLHWRAVEIDGQLLVFGSARDITAAKRLVQNLEDTSAQVRDLYDQAPCGYFSFDAEGRFVHINVVAARWLGEPILGADDHFAPMLDPANLQQFQDHFIALATPDHAPEIEVCLAPARGERRYVRINSTAVRDAQGNFTMSRTVAVDITAQREAQLQVHALLQDQSAMLNSDVVGMLKLRDGRVSWKNTAFEKMLGYGQDELLGMPIARLCAEENDRHALAQESLLLLRRGENYRDDVRLRRKDGEVLWVDLNGVQLSHDETFWMAVDITETKRTHAQIRHAAFHDALTQLPNRLLLLDRMRQALAGAERFGHDVAVCFMDLDGFKAVNDEHGHEAGDQLLVAIAARISGCIRATDTAARLGGDEFVLLLAPIAGDEWRGILERLLRSADAPVALSGGRQVNVGMSIGVALSRGRTQVDALLAEADEAMLHAKRSGKRRIHLAGSALP